MQTSYVVEFLTIALSGRIIIPRTVNWSSCIIARKRSRYQIDNVSVLSKCCAVFIDFYESAIFGDITAWKEELRSGLASKLRETARTGRRHKNLYGYPPVHDARQAYYVYGRIMPSLTRLARAVMKVTRSCLGMDIVSRDPWIRIGSESLMENYSCAESRLKLWLFLVISRHFIKITMEKKIDNY